ncbi:MAG TPA: hypothetical protein VG269_12890 [Tepidisphaeraceae bacterium]|jgi:hypothetical protein|nr:hypothetical protein [Tepidisphaeraceae bacterium]
MSKLLAIAALIGGSTVLTMVGAGCSSDDTRDHPSGLTGDSTAYYRNDDYYRNNDSYRSADAHRLAWTDEKGHYRSDWEAGINRPPEYPKAVARE